jgi:hypothetical protein
MIRKLSALSMILCLTACAAQSKRAAEPSMAPAPPSGGAAPEAAPATAAPASAAPNGEGAVEEPKTAPPPPPTVLEPPTGAAAGTKAPATKTPSTAPVPPTTTKPGADAGGGGGSKANTIGAAQASFDDARKTFIAAADCIHMCKALTSMSNATTHLCELTQGSSEQKRCTDAKSKLAAADAKVKSTCGGCD